MDSRAVRFYFGADYRDRVATLSRESVGDGALTTSAALSAAVAGLWFPMADRLRAATCRQLRNSSDICR